MATEVSRLYQLRECHFVRLSPLLEWRPIVVNVYRLIVGFITRSEFIDEHAFFPKMPVSDISLVGTICPLITDIESVSRLVGKQIVGLTVLVHDCEFISMHATHILALRD